MQKRHKLTDKQFVDAVRHFLLNKPGVEGRPIAEDEELTMKELEQSFGLDSGPPSERNFPR